MQIAESATRTKYPLSRKKILKKTLTGTSGWFGLLFIIWSAIIFATSQGMGDAEIGSVLGLIAAIGLLVLVVFLLFQYWYQSWYFATYYYDLEADNVVIRKHPITPKEITIPYSRIQDVYVDQDLLDRLMGLYDVHLSSATISSGFNAHIDGVERAAADGLRADILAQVKGHHQTK
ncbi:MAG: PH domain-containing protein [bacterium]|nr:PH domain-containing protein [bacterium]